MAAFYRERPGKSSGWRRLFLKKKLVGNRYKLKGFCLVQGFLVGSEVILSLKKGSDLLRKIHAANNALEACIATKPIKNRIDLEEDQTAIVLPVS